MLYTPYRDFLKQLFPTYPKIRKLPLNGGMTCPNLDGSKGNLGCTYCSNKAFSPVWDLDKTDILCQLEKFLPPLKKKYPDAGVLAYFQPYTNTYAPINKLKEVFLPILEHPEVVGIAIGTRPDCLPVETIDFLAEMNREKPIIVEVGLQTSNDETLKAVNRKHSFAEFKDAVERLHIAKLIVTTHLIVGLPHENLEDFKATAHAVKTLNVGAVKIHPLHLIKGTTMAQQYANGDFELLSFDAYCEAVAQMIRILGKGVAIERFSGENPSDLLLGPSWIAERDRIVKEVEKLLSLKKA